MDAGAAVDAQATRSVDGVPPPAFGPAFEAAESPDPPDPDSLAGVDDVDDDASPGDEDAESPEPAVAPSAGLADFASALDLPLDRLSVL